MIAVLAAFAMTHAMTSPTPNLDDARMEWWREARFGMFIHWGLYAIPAGEWGERKTHGEWIRDTGRIPLEEYDKFLDQFNPTKFDADAWCRMAKDAGMKYIVITSKHHDGFALWNSRVSDFDVMATPFKRDILDELADACRRHGIKMCFYHSIMDWHHPDYLPRRPWEAADRPVGKADFDRYVKYLRAQVTELLTRYGDVGIVWFDGEWESTWGHEYGQALYELCRELQPNVIVNDRVDVGRQGHTGVIAQGYAGDYGTPEQNIPGVGPGEGVDWETCMTMNGHWGYNAIDLNYKSTTDLVQKLADIASKGGNFLLNVGPKADGTFPQQSIDRLREIGVWMEVNGESIYGTQMSPFGNLEWGRCTVKPHGEDTSLYLHIFDWPADGRLTLPGIGNTVTGVRMLGQQSGVRVQREGTDLVFQLTGQPTNPHDTVIKVGIAGKPIIFKAPEIKGWADVFVGEMRVEAASAHPEIKTHYTLDGSDPTAASPLATGSIRITNTTTVKMQGFYEGKAVTPIAERRFSKVEPWSPGPLNPTGAGARVYSLEGAFEMVPDFYNREARKEQATAANFDLGAFGKREHVALLFDCYIRVPKDGVYRFALTSDDGSRLAIDGNLIIDNDGLHGAVTKEGYAPLAAGWHRVWLTWFNATGGAALDLKMAAPGQELKKIPDIDIRPGPDIQS